MDRSGSYPRRVTQVAGFESGVTSVMAGRSMCAIQHDALKCWGEGWGSQESRAYPIETVNFAAEPAR